MQTLKLPAGGHSFNGITWSSDDQKVWTTDSRGYLRSAKLTTAAMPGMMPFYCPDQIRMIKVAPIRAV
jgi:hypothetical protein